MHMTSSPSSQISVSQAGSITFNQPLQHINSYAPLATMRFVGTTSEVNAGKMAWYKTEDGKYVITQLETINIDMFMWKSFREFDTENELKLFIEVSGLEISEDSDAKIGDMIAKRYDDTYSISPSDYTIVTK